MMKSLYAFCISAISKGITQKTFSLEKLPEILPLELCYDIRQEYYSKMPPKLFLEELERCCEERALEELVMLCKSHRFFAINDGSCCYTNYPGIRCIIRHYTLYLACKHGNQELLDFLESSKDFKDHMGNVSSMQIYCAGVKGEIDNPFVLQAKHDCITRGYSKIWSYRQFLLGLYDGDHIETLIQELSSETSRYYALWQNYNYVRDCLPDVLDEHNINYTEALNEVNDVYHNKNILEVNGGNILESLTLKINWTKRLEKILRAFKKDKNDRSEINSLLLDLWCGDELFRADYGAKSFQQLLVRIYETCSKL